MGGGEAGRFFRLRLGWSLGHREATEFYNLIKFCSERLHKTYSEYLALPEWERRMYGIYLEIEDRKEQDRRGEQEEFERQLKHKGYK